MAPNRPEDQSEYHPVAQADEVPNRLGEFRILRELGRGSFAEVYLARQESLGRRVALKVTRQRSRGEGPILAALDHDHIVKVYSEFNDLSGGRNGLVLQYIPGTTLARVLTDLYGSESRPNDGLAILDAVDRQAGDDVDFDPAALGDRDLYRGEYVATVCRLAARLADALAYAHSHGVLHCDVKPANILINRYGRPLLVDFNVSVASPDPGDEPTALGGTIRYMSPEQLTLCYNGPDPDAPPIDHRSDLYSLGLVVLEALTGDLPHAEARCPELVVFTGTAAGDRNWMDRWRPKVPEPVGRVLAKCLSRDPAARYPSGRELAASLRRAADLLDSRARLPAPGLLGKFVLGWPLLALAVLTLAPHLLGSVVNITYNAVEVPLTDEQSAVFDRVTVAYNLVAYPLCVTAAAMAVGPLIAAFWKPDRLASLSSSELDRLRTRALSLGNWAVALAAVGWLPGGVLFPLIVDMKAGPLAPSVYGHLVLSFLLSGLIAVTYSFLGVRYTVLRGMYPRLTHPGMSAETTRLELSGVLRGLGVAVVHAALVPLTGAVLQLVLAPAELSLAFRLLVTGLIVAGMLGLGVAVLAADHMRTLVGRLRGPGSDDD